MDLRMATTEDAAAVQAIYAPYVESTPASFELVPPTIVDMAGRIRERRRTHPWLVAEADGSVVGYAYGGRFAARPAYDWSVETTVYVARKAHRRGAGRALYTALLHLLAAQGYRQAMAGITLPNPASVALHERLGFVQVATFAGAGWKFGTDHDVGWWQRPLTPEDVPRDGTPASPVPVTDLPAEVLASILGTR